MTKPAQRSQRVDDAGLHDSTSADRPVVVSRLVARFVLTGLVALVVVAVSTAYASRVLGTNEAIADADRAARLVTTAALEPALSPDVIAQDPTALAALDAVVRDHVLDDSLVRVKVWSPDGTILYSDEPRLIGSRFELDADELALITSGGTRAEVSDLSEPENRYEDEAVELLEVYLPVRTTSGDPLLVEVYFHYAGVAAAGRDVWLRYAPYWLGALVLLVLLQVPLAISMGRRLRRTQHEREELLRSVIEAADEERRRIASDLHDGVVQDLAGVAFSLGALVRQDGRPPAESAEIRQAADRVRDGVRSLRSLLVEIYPPNLYEEGLEAVLSDLLARLEPRGIAGTLVVEAPLERLDLDRTQLLYRVAQEGVRNVIAHADARRVTVSITSNGDMILLEVVDDGRGVAGLEVPDRPGHLGLRGLANLAASLGARLTLRSTPGRGTVLALDVPIT
jgi:two-component system NarL family sensor kinase